MQENRAVYSKSPFWKLSSWYGSLGDINCSKPASLVTYNGKKYAIRNVKSYGEVGPYHNSTYFSCEPKDYYAIIRKRNFELLIKKIICVVTLGIIPKLVQNFKRGVTFLGNETAIKIIMSSAVLGLLNPMQKREAITSILQKYENEDADLKILKKLWDESITANNYYCKIAEKKEKVEYTVREKARLESCDKDDIYEDGKKKFESKWCERIGKMSPLELVEFLESDESKKFFEIERLEVDSRFYSKEVPSIINRFTKLKDLKLRGHIISKIQRNAFSG
jgi:hypothetical protein